MNRATEYLVSVDPAHFDLDEYLLSIDEKMLETPEGRRELTREDPLLFALIYLPHHLRGAIEDDPEAITFSEYHIRWALYGRTCLECNKYRQGRDVFVAPRHMGKSTWLFTIIPIWAAAHGHVKFIAAFSDTADQAKTHLGTFRDELDTNDLLREDFPKFVESKRRRIDPNAPRADKLVGKPVTDRQDRIEQANGFIFAAAGVTSGISGVKVGRRRPEFMILDDVEPTEDKYGPAQIEKRTKAIVDKILYLNEHARVVVVGTVTCVGSIIHQFIRHELSPSDDDPKWIDQQNFKVHYMPPILQNDDGSERSCWPEKWPFFELNSRRNDRDYKKNFENQPVNIEGDYWSSEDIEYDPGFISNRRILLIDPAVRLGKSSDYTGIGVVSFNIPTKQSCIEWTKKVKLAPKELRRYIESVLEDDEDISAIIVEINQGGDYVLENFQDLGVKVIPRFSRDSKVDRFGKLLTHYQRHRVVHRREIPSLEEQMFAYRGREAGSDDLLDVASFGVDFFYKKYSIKKQPNRVHVTNVRYL